jgi:hypothetical protein
MSESESYPLKKNVAAKILPKINTYIKITTSLPKD